MNAQRNGSDQPDVYSEAVERHLELGQQMAELDRQISRRRPRRNAPNHEWNAYRYWRGGALEQRDQLEAERRAIEDWLQDNAAPSAPVVVLDLPLSGSAVRALLSAEFAAVGVRLTRSEQNNISRRLFAEAACQRMRSLLAGLVEEFGEHDPCEPGCSACELITAARRESAVQSAKVTVCRSPS